MVFERAAFLHIEAIMKLNDAFDSQQFDRIESWQVFYADYSLFIAQHCCLVFVNMICFKY